MVPLYNQLHQPVTVMFYYGFLTIPETAAHMSLDYFYLQSNLQTLTKYLFYAFMNPYLTRLENF